MTQAPPSSMLPSAKNFRDLAGARTADGRRFVPGLLYRSGLLSGMTPEDRKRFEAEFGIRTVIDLRRDREPGTDAASAVNGVRTLTMPLTPKDVRVLIDKRPSLDAVVAWYRRQLEVSQERIREVVEAIAAHGDEPLVFHCHAGKDRTGVLSAVLLGGLGVVREDVVADYARSRTDADDVWFNSLPEIFREARPEVMGQLLEQVDEEFGSMRGYLEEIGLSDDTLRVLERRYLGEAD